MDGILLINKPKGWTSHDVVAKVRGVLRKETSLKKLKVGHAGTLDPQATGLLIILVGSYCKRAPEFLKLNKTYDVEVTLGQTSTTDDSEGEKTPVSSAQPTKEQVNEALNKFVGEIEQIPPQFSAIKVDGKRAYSQARLGKKVDLKSRKVTIHSIKNTDYDYPHIRFTADVSSGTYIRSLARDIGEELGVGAYMSDLERPRIDKYKLIQAVQPNVEILAKRVFQP
ncbi:tRNA pseudouridine(55) synthase TruB [Candidatus Saccharibacteria bacterium]|nr:tRNA pseudouridine(55) synthase TruB [Candidatus Saccharibacteria bacterium]